MKLKSIETIKKPAVDAVSDRSEEGEIIKKSLSAADRLFDMQKEDGEFITIIKASGEITEQKSRSRGILSAWALADFGNFVGKEKYIMAARKSFVNYDERVSREKGKVALFDLVFMGQLSLSLGEDEKALGYAQKILDNIDPMDKEKACLIGCSLLGYIASFLIIASSFDQKFLDPASIIAKSGKDLFEASITRNNQPQELTLYAELPRTFLLLFGATGYGRHLDFSRKVIGWILENQLKNGSFRVKSNDDSANSGASARIVETIALFANHPEFVGQKDTYSEAVRRALSWILSMQHDENNICDIEPRIYSGIVGSFRRSYDSSEIRIDAIAHFLLAITRLDLKNNPSIIGNRESPLICYPLLQQDAKCFEKNTGNNLMRGDARPKLFFGKSFRLDIFFNSYLRKILSRFTSLDKSRQESPLGYSNDILRNYSYLIELLTEKNILKNISVANTLKKTKWKAAPAFYEAFISSDFHWTRNGASGPITCFGRGFSENWATCLGKALGEFLERYFHLFPHSEKQLVRASEKELEQKKMKHIPIIDLAVFSEEQKGIFSKRSWNEDSKFYWEKCRRYSTGEETLIPAQLIYWGYRNYSGEPLLREKNTNGLGGFFSPEGAILSGLYEVIQRDAFFNHWLNKITPQKIELKSIKNDAFRKNCEDIKKNGFEITCLHLPSDTRIPVIISIIKDKSGGPYYSLGAGCNLDIDKAMRRSLEEAWSVYYYVAKIDTLGQEELIPESYKPFEMPLDTNKRLLLWSNPAMKDKLDFFTDGKAISFEDIRRGQPEEFKSKKEELDYVVKNTEKLGKGYEIYVHLARHKILKQVGYTSARVIVPQFLPLYSRERNAPLDHPRLRGKNINSLPHPFP